jgi:hypothetical protein
MGPEPTSSKSDAERRRAKAKPQPDALQDVARPLSQRGDRACSADTDLDDWYANPPCTD